MEQWEKNYYISSIAGANNGSSLVVMSKGLLRAINIVRFPQFTIFHMAFELESTRSVHCLLYLIPAGYISLRLLSPYSIPFYHFENGRGCRTSATSPFVLF